MNATIYSHKTIIGTADLQIGDQSMGGVYGQFIPNDNYYNYTQKCIWKFVATRKPDYKIWYSLRFNAQLDNGFFLFPYGGYTFNDSPNFPDEAKRIDILGINIEILNFKNNILLEPWDIINIERKIYFEDELIREITPPKSALGFLGIDKRKEHTLLNAEFSAFAKYGPNDDVLFEVKKKGEENRLATVHLTYSKNENLQPDFFPATHFFSDFNDFAEKRLRPDNIEWNA